MNPAHSLRCGLLATALGGALPCHAAIVDDSSAGASSGFFWESAGALGAIVDLGPGDGVSDEAAAPAGWSLSVASPSFLDIAMTVYNRPPTVFDLVIDGSIVAWTHAEVVPEVISPEAGELIHHFNATLDDRLLSAGTHFVTLIPSQDNVDASTGMVRFFPVTPIPEPSTLAFLALGLLGLGARLWRRM